jgi:hypothetical protein
VEVKATPRVRPDEAANLRLFLAKYSDRTPAGVILYR